MALEIQRGPIKVIPREPQCVFFLDPWVGWIGGLYGNLLKTVNGGFTWSIQSSPVSGPVNDIFFTSSKIGFAAGWQPGTESMLCRTRDGGKSWSSSLTSRTQPTLPIPSLTDPYHAFDESSGGPGFRGTVANHRTVGPSVLKFHQILDEPSGWNATAMKRRYGGVRRP